MKKEEELQQLAVQFQILQANMQLVHEREGIVLKSIEELQKTRQAIEDLNGMKPSSTFIPIGSGNFIKGEIKNTNDIIVGVGGDVAIRRSREDAVEILDSRIKEMENVLNGLSEQEKGIIVQLTEIQNKAEKLQKG